MTNQTALDIAGRTTRKYKKPKGGAVGGIVGGIAAGLVGAGQEAKLTYKLKREEQKLALEKQRKDWLREQREKELHETRLESIRTKTRGGAVKKLHKSLGRLVDPKQNAVLKLTNKLRTTNIVGGAIIPPDSLPHIPGMRTTTKPFVTVCTNRHTIAANDTIFTDGRDLLCPIDLAVLHAF